MVLKNIAMAGFSAFTVVFSMPLFAQQVYTENGLVVIDNSAMSGKSRKSTQEVADSKTTNGILKRHEKEKETLFASNPDVNAKVSPKFAVSPQNVSESGVAYTSPNITTYYWEVAAGWDISVNDSETASVAPTPTGCAAYGGPNGGEQGEWRMPTFREVMLMVVFRSKLEAQPNFTAFSTDNYYWTATESGLVWCFGVIFSNGKSAMILKSRGNNSYPNYYLRCVKDL